MKLKQKFIPLSAEDVADTDTLKALTTTAQTIEGEQHFSTLPSLLNLPGSPAVNMFVNTQHVDEEVSLALASGQAMDWEFLPDRSVRLIRYNVTIPSDAIPVAIIDQEKLHPLPYAPPTPRPNCTLQYREVCRVVPVLELICSFDEDAWKQGQSYQNCQTILIGYRTVTVIEAFEVCP